MSDELQVLLGRLLERTGQGAKLGLARMREALQQLGSPEAQLPVVHVAGTNGKGSTCAMVESIGRAAGLRTGLYTSPHLSRFNERIVIDGAPIADAPFAAALSRAMDDALPRLSFFEVLTVAALCAMRSAEVDLAIVEVGLGGRLDATNVVEQPRCTAIASIGRDHTRHLGEDLASIAREKAGIAKRGVPLVLGPIAEPALGAILDAADAVGSRPVWRVARDGSDGDIRVASSGTANRFDVSIPGSMSLRIQPGLSGAHQIDNAAVACGVAAQVLPALVGQGWRDCVVRGIADARWPGRLERIARGGVDVLLDCAHNTHALAALQRSMAELERERTLLVFGAIEDKPWRALLDGLAPHARERIYCEPLSEEIAGRRSMKPQALAAIYDGRCATSHAEALELALARARAGDTVLVAGSVFLVGGVRAALLDQPQDVVVPL